MVAGRGGRRLRVEVPLGERHHVVRLGRRRPVAVGEGVVDAAAPRRAGGRPAGQQRRGRAVVAVQGGRLGEDAAVGEGEVLALGKRWSASVNRHASRGTVIGDGVQLETLHVRPRHRPCQHH